MPYAEVGDQRLYYEIHGQGEPLLCVTGIGLDVTGWRAQIPAWSRALRVVVFDNRDTGRSTYVTQPYEVRDLAADTIGLADQLELERFHLLGISLGGAVAQEVALSNPARVRSLTLCVSYAGSGLWGRERARLAVESSARKSDEEFVDEVMLLSLSEATYEGFGRHLRMMRRVVLENPYRQRREGFLRQLQASAGYEARDRLGSLTMPVHVIGVDQDVWIPVRKSHELAELIPGAKLSIISRAAHAVHAERPREFNAAVLDFLRLLQGVGEDD
jgi:3-oxoadipate enol-lactonase